MNDIFSAFWLSAGMTGPPCESTAFGDTCEQQDALSALVLSRQKRATTSLARWYGPSSKPKPGDRMIFVDGAGNPRGIIETRQVQETRFCDVVPEFAQIEGEGDASLEYWVTEHERYFRKELAKEGLEFGGDEPVILEYFELIWPMSTPLPEK